jgi:hypothetical protein
MVAPRASKASESKVTYFKDIEPIIRQNCAECHRPGECAPFSLLNYSDVQRRAQQIALVTEKRFMPPWSADASDVSFRDCRRLTSSQIAILSKWVEQGSVQGKPAPHILALPPTVGWLAGEPDIVLSLPAPFPITADGPEIYHRFVLPLHLPRDRWLRMAVFRPDSPRIIRMAMLSLDDNGISRTMAAKFDSIGYSSMVGQILPSSDNFGEWAPGARAYPMPAGVGVLVKKGADLIVLLRLDPDGKAEKAQFKVGLYFSGEPPRTELTTIALGDSNLYIRPGENNRVVQDRFTIPVDVQAFSILAHAHTLCRKVRAIAALPSGKRLILLTISNWNPSWQRPYTFTSPVRLPAGTRIEVKFTYDNSTPPPPGSLFNATMVGEMAYLELQSAPERKSDQAQLRSAIQHNMKKK